jgi:type 1 glutamine amidotransferase
MIDSNDRKPTRRTSIRMLGIGGALAALELGGSRRLAAAAATKATAFALYSDVHHPGDYIKIALTTTLVDEAGVSIDFTADSTELSAERLDGYKMLIIYSDGGLPRPGGGTRPGEASMPKTASIPQLPQSNPPSASWITAAQGKAVKDFVEAGGAALFYHNTTHISLFNTDFRAVHSGAYKGHPQLRPFKVVITDHDHPITRGVSDFVIADEQHYMDYDKDPKFVFMKSVNENGLTYRDLGNTANSGWAYDYGKGRVCYIAPGHTTEVLRHPEYVKIQHNAAKWLLRQA